MRKASRGMSVAELLVASFIFLMIALVAERVMNYVQSVDVKSRAQVEPRQQIRSALANLSSDLRSAAYIYSGFSGSIAGTPLHVPPAGQAGDSLVFAVPQDDTNDIAYAVCAVFLRPRSQPDPNNAGVREIVYVRFEPLTTTPPNTPGALDPSSLAGGTSKVFDAYIPPGPPTGPSPPFAITVSPGGTAADFLMTFRVTPMRGPTVSERFQTLVTMRNNA